MEPHYITLPILLAMLGFATAVEPDEFEGIATRIAGIQPQPEEKRLDEIGWADDIRHALRLAKQHRRPVFLFTHDGRINLGRC